VGGGDGKFAATPDFVADDLAAAAQIILRHGILEHIPTAAM
jgi:hypothetical protein